MNNSIKQFQQLMETNWPECAETAYPALLRLGQVNDIFQQTLQHSAEDYQLQKADFGVLCALRRSPSPHCLSPTKLYQSMLFSSGGLTKVLSRLSQAGLIDRHDNPDDKRSKLVQLTAAGKQLVEKVLPELHQQEKRILQALNTDELTQLDTLLRRILDQYE